MAEFNFGKKVIICGHTFWLDAGNDMYMAKKDDLTNEAKELAKNQDEQAMTRMIEIYRQYVDLLLGSGAFDTIFEGRTPNPYDMTNLMKYLTEEMGGNPNLEAEDTRSENRILLDEILDGMDDAQLTQLTTIAEALNK